MDVIISGIGGVPKFTWQGPTLEDPHICENGTKSILQGLASLKGATEAKKPRLCVISTTGLSQTRDVPHLMRPLYWILLQVRLARGFLFLRCLPPRAPWPPLYGIEY